MGVFDSVITACVTVIVGVAIYVLGQIASKFFIEPIHKQDEIRGEIADSLAFYAPIYTNPGAPQTPEEEERKRETANVLRQKATLLESRTHLIRWYRLFSWLSIIPERENVEKARGNLTGLSNSIFKGKALQNNKWAEEIKDFLNLK